MLLANIVKEIDVEYMEWKLMLIVEMIMSLLKNSRSGILWPRNLQISVHDP